MKNNNWLLLVTTISLWCIIGMSCLPAQPTMRPTVVWEMDNKTFLIDIQSVIPLDDKGNSLLLGYDAKKALVALAADSKGGLTELSKTKLSVTFKITAIQAISKEEVLLAGLTGNQTITYASVHLKTGKVNWAKLLPKERKGTISAIIPNKKGFLLAGKTKHKSGSNENVLLVYVDKSGKEQWHHQYGSDIGTEEILNGVADSKGGFLLAAYSDDFNAKEFYAWVLRLDAKGHNVWERKFGTPKHSTVAYSVCEGENGHPIFAGTIDDQIRITQLDKNHDTGWSQYIGKPTLRYTAKGVTYSKDNHCYLYGNVYDKKGKVISIYSTKLNGKKRIKPTPKDKKKHKKDKILKDKQLKFELVRENVLQKVTLKDGIYTTPNQIWDVGDTYEFYTTKPKSGYLYVFSIDGNRKVMLHYPRKGQETVTDSKKIIIPNKDSSLIIEAGGFEYLLAIYSTQKLENLESLLATIQKAKGPVRTAIAELLKPLGFQAKGVAYQKKAMVLDIEKSTSPILPIIVELTVTKGQDPKKETTQPDLHILTIGLNDAGFSAPLVEFAEKDAIDFTNLIKSMRGKTQYKNIHSRQLLGDKVTLAGIKTILQQQNKAVKKGDVCIIFFSLPFKKIADTIRLLPVNFDAAQVEATSITYQQLMEQFSSTNHRKIIFMDSRYAPTLNHTNPNLAIINSANANEPVFEHEDWENSAFTVALLEAFSNYQQKVNTHNDNILTLQEIFDYLKIRVQALAKQKFNKVQTPTIGNSKFSNFSIIVR